MEQWVTEKHKIDEIVNTLHHFSSGVYARQMFLAKGLKAYSHAHPYDHMSILAKGSVIVTVEGASRELVAPAVIEVVANKIHEIFAKDDSVWFCIHATEETDVNKIDEVLIGG